MPLIFNKRFVEKIQSGIKTVTRRGGKSPRVKVGNEYTLMWCYAERGKFGKVKVVSVSRGSLGDMTEDDAKKEGFDSLEDFKTYWKETQGRWSPKKKVWVIEFVLLQVDSASDEALLAVPSSQIHPS